MISGSDQAPIRTLRRAPGGTGHQVWNSSHILKSLLLSWDAKAEEGEWLPLLKGAHPVLDSAQARNASEPHPLPVSGQCPPKQSRSKTRARCTLELGAGTGHLAVSLALAGWRGILATDGEAATVRNMKYNVQSNRLGHAVRCLKWSWEDSPPRGLALADIDLVIGSDLVYYNRTHGMLAAVLHDILTARSPDDPRPAAKAFLLCCVRQAHEDGGGQVVHHLCDQGYSGSSMQGFIEEELPDRGLYAHRHQIPEQIFDALIDESTLEVLASAENRAAYHLYEVGVQKTS